jgi:hypothetical protein
MTKITQTRSVNSNNVAKLRLVNNNYYRFGFDNGIAVIFDD